MPNRFSRRLALYMLHSTESGLHGDGKEVAELCSKTRARTSRAQFQPSYQHSPLPEVPRVPDSQVDKRGTRILTF